MKLTLLIVGLVVLSLLAGGPAAWSHGPFGLLGDVVGTGVGIFGGVVGLVVGLAGGIFGAAVGLVAGLFGAAVGLAAGLFGAVVGLAAVAAVFGVPLMIVGLVIYAVARVVA